MPDCGKIVPRRRISYCSRECAEKFSVAYFPSQTRRHVFQRDRGVCAICGLDTERMRRVLKWVKIIHRQHVASWAAFIFGYDGFYAKGHFWQADHIHECAKGGWGKGLENFRTLCTPCHKAQTKRLAGELAELRRQKRNSLFAEAT